jgi:KaiC/GvpD/RAD55 family RecA-like ATPase
MAKLRTNIKWLDDLLPEGILVPSSTLISGPGGSGKPLVEFAFVDAWLKAGGSLIGIPLQYPSCELVKTAMHKLYHNDLTEYHGKIIFIEFDPSASRCKKIADDRLKANLLKPHCWDEAIDKAESMLEKTDLGTMIFGSALNLLFFSKTYSDSMLEKLKDALKNDKSCSYLFAVSSSALADKIKILEKVADNLMYTRMENDKKLFLKITRMKEVPFSAREIHVPIPKNMLAEIRKIAELTRNTRIPEIKQI